VGNGQLAGGRTLWLALTLISTLRGAYIGGVGGYGGDALPEGWGEGRMGEWEGRVGGSGRRPSHIANPYLT
jgi:hypothetical protein